MDKLIVYVDDADHALHLLHALLGEPGRSPTHWVLVGCAPRVTHHVSRWVTNSARESWRGRWADKTFARLTPLLSQGGDQVVTRLASNKLAEQTAELMEEYGDARVLDARRPRSVPAPAPVTAAGHAPPNLLSLLATMTSSGLLVAAD